MSETAPFPSEPEIAGSKLRCPICGSGQFQEFRGRVNEQCAKCNALARTRLLWMILKKKRLLKRGFRVMHIAPESTVSKRLFELSGDRYYACDIDPSRYAKRSAVVRPIDLCCDLVKLPSCSFDLIIHTHVLEHVRCQPEFVLHELERILAPGGHHVFGVPTRGEETREDLSDDMPPEQRTAMFGQDNHYRLFGSRSLQEMLDRVWGKRERHHIEPLELFGAEALEEAAISRRHWTGISGVTAFHHMRPRSGLGNSTRQMPSEPVTEKSANPDAAPFTTNAPAVSRPDVPNLILHIGMPNTGAASLQRWLARSRAAAFSAGLDYWSIAQNHSDAMMLAFADSQEAAERTAARRRESGQEQLAPETIGRSLDQFLAGLAKHTGFISAERLWTFPSLRVEALANYLRDRDIRPTILCWICRPAEYVTQAALKECQSSLTVDDLGHGFETKNPLRFNRLKAWVEHFGSDRVIVAPFDGDPVPQTRNLLESLGIRLESAKNVETASAMSLTAVKALLALNHAQKSAGAATRWSPRLRGMLGAIKGADFHLPESVLQGMGDGFRRDTKYLVEQFSLDREWLLSGGIGTDDPLFFGWNWDEVVCLLTALDEAIRQSGTKKPRQAMAALSDFARLVSGAINSQDCSEDLIS